MLVRIPYIVFFTVDEVVRINDFCHFASFPSEVLDDNPLMRNFCTLYEFVEDVAILNLL